MHLKKAISIVQCCLMITYLFGCSDKRTNSENIIDQKTITFSEFSIEEHIIFKNIYEYKEGISCNLQLIDSTLVCMNVSNQPNFFFFNYNLVKGDLSSGYLNYGRGPGELIGVMSFGVVGDLFWVYDITTKKILTAEKKKALTEGEFAIRDEFAVKQDQYWINLKDSLHYYGVGSPNSNYSIQERELFSGKLAKEYGEYKNIPDDISLPAYNELKQNFIFVKPKGDMLVLVRRFEDVIEIYDTEKQTLIKRVHGPEGFNAEGLVEGDSFIRNKNTRISFLYGALTNNYIYLTYSGHLDFDENPYLTQCVYVYDWEGNPIRKIVFENNVGSIAVSADDKTMYAFDENTGYILQAEI